MIIFRSPLVKYHEISISRDRDWRRHVSNQSLYELPPAYVNLQRVQYMEPLI